MSGRRGTGTRQGPTADSNDPKNGKKKDPEQGKEESIGSDVKGKGKGKDNQPLAGQGRDSQAKDDSQKLPSNGEKELWYTRGHLVNIIDIITPAIKGEEIPGPRKLLRYKDLDDFKDPGKLMDKLNEFGEHIEREKGDGVVLTRLILSVQEVNKYLKFYKDVEGLKAVIKHFEDFGKAIVGLKDADATTKKMWEAEYVQYLTQLPLPSSPSHHHHHTG